jgi:hypothetical protein
MQAASGVDPGDRTAARAQCMNVDRWQFDWNTELDEPLGGDSGGVVMD